MQDLGTSEQYFFESTDEKKQVDLNTLAGDPFISENKSNQASLEEPQNELPQIDLTTEDCITESNEMEHPMPWLFFFNNVAVNHQGFDAFIDEPYKRRGYGLPSHLCMKWAHFSFLVRKSDLEMESDPDSFLPIFKVFFKTNTEKEFLGPLIPKSLKRRYIISTSGSKTQNGEIYSICNSTIKFVCRKPKSDESSFFLYDTYKHLVKFVAFHDNMWCQFLCKNYHHTMNLPSIEDIFSCIPKKTKYILPNGQIWQFLCTTTSINHMLCYKNKIVFFNLNHRPFPSP